MTLVSSYNSAENPSILMEIEDVDVEIFLVFTSAIHMKNALDHRNYQPVVSQIDELQFYFLEHLLAQ